MSDLAAAGFATVEALDRSPSPIAIYRDRLNQRVLPALGAVKVRELTVALLHRHINAVTARCESRWRMPVSTTWRSMGWLERACAVLLVLVAFAAVTTYLLSPGTPGKAA